MDRNQLTEPTSKFLVGDIVRPVCGGPDMVIEEVDATDDKGRAGQLALFWTCARGIPRNWCLPPSCVEFAIGARRVPQEVTLR